MADWLANRVFELFHIRIPGDACNISLFELGLSVEQVLYFLVDISNSHDFNLERYYRVMKNASLGEILNSIQDTTK